MFFYCGKLIMFGCKLVNRFIVAYNLHRFALIEYTGIDYILNLRK